jgi:hypothetical protein
MPGFFTGMRIMVTAILVLIALRGLIALGRAQSPGAPSAWLRRWAARVSQGNAMATFGLMAGRILVHYLSRMTDGQLTRECQLPHDRVQDGTMRSGGIDD